MSKDRVIDSLGRIDDDMIPSVEGLRRKKKRPIWLKWGAVAACLCLAVIVAIPVFHSRNVHDSDDCLLETATFEYCGGFYEVVDIPRVLERYGLPSKITADMAGDHLT